MKLKILCRDSQCDRRSQCAMREIEVDERAYMRGLQKANAKGNRGMIDLDVCAKYGKFFGVSFMLVQVNGLYTNGYVEYLKKRESDISSSIENGEKRIEMMKRAKTQFVSMIDETNRGETLISASRI